MTVVAPGNTVRLHQDFDGGAVSALRVTTTARYQVTHFVVPWLTDIRLTLATLLVLTSSWFSVPPWAQRGDRIRLAVVPLVAAASVLVTFLLMALKVGAVGAPRIYNYAYGVFLAGWLASLAAWSGRLRLSAGDGAGAFRAVAAALFALSLFGASNTRGYLGDLVGKETARRFHRQMAQIYGALRDASHAGAREARIPALPRTPASFFGASLGPVATHWQNRCVASFFGLERVAVSADGGYSSAASLI